MADRIIVMNGGKIDQADDPKTCYLKPRTALVAGLLGAGNDLKDISILGTGENGACRIQVGEEQVEGTYFPAQEKRAETLYRHRKKKPVPDSSVSAPRTDAGLAGRRRETALKPGPSCLPSRAAATA